MKPAIIALAIAAGAALAGCASPTEQVAMQCATAGPPGTPAYTACLHSEQLRQSQLEQQRLNEKTELDQRLGVGGVGGHT